MVPGPRRGGRGAIVLDDLIHRGDIPVTIGAFVDPGVFPDADNPKNRNNEYDAFDDRYVTAGCGALHHRPVARRWGICGGSSGGDCAGFAQTPGNNPYPDLISRVPRKPLRIFMQGGHRDLHWNEPQWNRGHRTAPLTHRSRKPRGTTAV
ncbi:hypothetical protein QFZ66_003967 [Streptomyces sp. B4I13]|uniref:hypothetical protein n=1 Tax=Streptomyces sp. B4I13 TaxID=3042271 RepID=UPI0027854420|nr:hypothetical protein [Streptomyces sp. B4I13]MDQ0960089.1 hypothetical protein [Streptomyces sp. B4I13]